MSYKLRPESGRIPVLQEFSQFPEPVNFFDVTGSKERSPAVFQFTPYPLHFPAKIPDFRARLLVFEDRVVGFAGGVCPQELCLFPARIHRVYVTQDIQLLFNVKEAPVMFKNAGLGQ